MRESMKYGRVEMLAKMSGTLKKYWLKTVFNILSGVLKEGFSILSAALCAYMVAMAIRGAWDDGNALLLMLAASITGFGVFRYVESFIAHDVAFHTLVDFRVAMYAAFEKICPDILLKSKAGQLSATLMNDVEILEWFFGHTAGSIVVTTVTIIGILSFLAWLHPLLLITMVIGVTAVFVVPFLFKDTADKQGLINRYRLGEANSVTLEGLNGVKEILMLNYKDRYKKKNSDFMAQLTDTQIAYAKRQGLEGGMLQAAVGLAAIAVNLVAVSLAQKGLLAIEWYAVVGTTVWLAFGPILELCGNARTFGIIFASASRVYSILHSKPLVDDTGADMPVAAIEPSIEFQRVSFKYETALSPTIKDVSFRIEQGEMAALVGESGAGKTTCINLLMRLWDVDSGSIRIGGHDIKSLSLITVHSLISAVLQDVYVFNIPIRENIRLGNPDAADEQVIRAAKQAQAHEFIENLPDGYDTVVGERGSQLSGGQRQKVAIARALLTSAPILVFDEAVSNLDTASEREIRRILQDLKKTRTVVMVAHRLSTIVGADKLIVLRDGGIEEIGTHRELIQKEGYYKELVASQL